MSVIRYDISSISPGKLCIIPVLILALSMVSLGLTWLDSGLPVRPGMEFEGGLGVTIIADNSNEQIESLFTDYPLVSIDDGINNGKYLKFGPMEETKVSDLTSIIDHKWTDAKIDYIGSSFGKSLQDQAAYAIILSFIGMIIVVFLIFRSFVPSFAIVISAVADMAMTAAMMNVCGIQLSLGTTAALLMLIGYSVDSDILLTSRVLKRKGSFDEKVTGAFRTGIIMTTTTFSAVFAMWVVSWVGGIAIIHEMSQVLLIGLLFDLINTWLTNAGILKWYVTRSSGKFSTKLYSGA